MPKILIVEDTPEFQTLIARILGEYEIVCASSAEEAGVQLRNQTFDMAVIDINLPQKDGYFLLSEIQASNDLSEMPVLCLTGRQNITDKITAFSLGADDYLTKPFDPLELKARVDSKLKKRSRKQQKDLTTKIGDIEIDHARHRVTVKNDDRSFEVELTQTEFKILCCLARRPDQVYSRDQLLVAAWGQDASVLERVVDAHVCLLRKKLKSHAHYVKAVLGIGYKISPRSKIQKAM